MLNLRKIVSKYHRTNMTMKILFIIVLSIIRHAPLVWTAGNIPYVICTFGGTLLNSNYTLSVSDVPKRCEAVVIAAYFTDSKTAKADTDAMASLVAQNISVYTLVAGMQKSPWEDLMNNNESVLIAPMVKFIIDNNLSGVILDMLGEFDGTIEDYACKLKTFICTLKYHVQKKLPDFVVAIDVMGQDALSFTNKKLFDFSVVNDELAFIIVDATTTGYMCYTESAISGRFPLKPVNDSSVISLDHICKGVAGSTMDKNKVILSFLVQVTMTNTPKAADSQYSKSYSQYCQRPEFENGTYWCADSAKLVYDMVNYAKKYFKGISLFPLDYDDTDNSCCCGKFVVANTFIDAWQSKKMNGCALIDS